MSLNNQIERYLGTHQGNGEAFLAKVLNKIQGEQAVNEFIAQSPAGFNETDGFAIEIKTGSDNRQEITLNYKIGGDERSAVIDENLLDGLIKQRQELEQKVRQAA